MSAQQLSLPVERLSASDLLATFEKAFKLVKPRATVPPLKVAFYPYSNLNHTIRRRDGQIYVRLSDIMREASHQDIEAIAMILLCKLYRRPIPAATHRQYRRFANRRAVRERIHQVRRSRGRLEQVTVVGRVYNLDEMLRRLARQYRIDTSGVSAISWTRSVSTTVLGRYDRAHHRILINRALDHPDIPQYFVEYLVYHEMLHSCFDDVFTGDLRRSHHSAFLAAEKKFRDYKKANQFLRSISGWIAKGKWRID